MHEQQLDVLEVADKEGLVAGGHHVAGLLVGAEADLQVTSRSAKTVPFLPTIFGDKTYAGHGHGAPEASPDTVVDTLRLAPAGVDALEPVTLVTVEALRAYTTRPVNTSILSKLSPRPVSLVQSPHRFVGQRRSSNFSCVVSSTGRGTR